MSNCNDDRDFKVPYSINFYENDPVQKGPCCFQRFNALKFLIKKFKKIPRVPLGSYLFYEPIFAS